MTKNRYTAAILLIALILSFAREADHRRAVVRNNRTVEKHEQTIRAEKLKAVRFEILARELEWEVKGLKAAAKHTDTALAKRMIRILGEVDEMEGDR